MIWTTHPMKEEHTMAQAQYTAGAYLRKEVPGAG
jgi:hypothetical protein